MRVILQRVSSASVTIEARTTGRINRGLLVFVGVDQADTEEDGRRLAEKLASLRIFSDPAGQMNLSIRDIGGEILVISQFTLFARTQKGARPSFNGAARPEIARPLYDRFVFQLSQALGRPVATGEFGAKMEVALINDGPVTLILDSQRWE